MALEYGYKVDPGYKQEIEWRQEELVTILKYRKGSEMIDSLLHLLLALLADPDTREGKAYERKIEKLHKEFLERTGGEQR